MALALHDNETGTPMSELGQKPNFVGGGVGWRSIGLLVAAFPEKKYSKPDYEVSAGAVGFSTVPAAAVRRNAVPTVTHFSPVASEPPLTPGQWFSRAFSIPSRYPSLLRVSASVAVQSPM